jgi:hypothetical protein
VPPPRAFSGRCGRDRPRYVGAAGDHPGPVNRDPGAGRAGIRGPPGSGLVFSRAPAQLVARASPPPLTPPPQVDSGRAGTSPGAWPVVADHPPHGKGCEPMKVRWLYSEADGNAHVLDESDPAESGTVLTRCRQMLPDTTPIYQIAPSMNLCSRCGPYAALPPPEHSTCPESRFPPIPSRPRPVVGSEHP